MNLFFFCYRNILEYITLNELFSYGYAEYHKESQVKSAITKYKDAELGGQKLFVYKVLKDRPTSLLSTKDFRNAMQTIKQAENVLNRQGRFMNPIQKRNLIQVCKITLRVIKFFSHNTNCPSETSM